MSALRRAFAGALAAMAAAFVCAVPADAAAPPVQVGDLRAGTAILDYDSTRARDLAAFDRALRDVGVRTAFFRRLGLVAVRGTAVEVRRAARLSGVRSAHMDARIKLLLHESVPLVYGGAHDSTWASGFDGRGGSVAVVDSGVDGTHPDLQQRTVANVKVVDPREFFGAGEPVYLECPIACNTDLTGGHGTHVAGTVAGDGTASEGFYRGVAPGTNIVGLSVGEVITVLYPLAAFEWILANHQKYGIVAVNNSWGPVSDGVRFDGTDPINVASKAMNDAGLTVVFAAGNGGRGEREDPPGASDCSTTTTPDGGREASDGACKINPYSVAPWTLSVANGRKDEPGGAGAQHLNFTSSRGDPNPQLSLDGQTIEYMPTLTAPGTNVRAARGSLGTTTPIACGGVAEPPACVPPAGAAQYEPFYMPLTGTSMASPHVAGAVAVLQSRAQASLGRRLTPTEVRSALVSSATPMTGSDNFHDWPCGSPVTVPCGEPLARMTGRRYERWQVGAGYLNMTDALDRVASVGASSSGEAPAGEPPAPLPATPPPGGSSEPQRTVLGPTPAELRRQRALLKKCRTKASRKKTRRARARARARCQRLYGSRR